MSTDLSRLDASPTAWTEADSADFIASGHLFIPQEGRVRRMILSLLDSVAPTTHIAELGCGAGRLLSDVAGRHALARLLAVDRSTLMIDAARQRCLEHVNRIQFRSLDLVDAGVLDGASAFDAVYSSLTIHHLDDLQKVALFQRVYDGLRTGGIFVYFDMFMPVSALGLSIAAEEWPLEVQSQGNASGSPGAVDRFNELRWNYYADPAGDPSDKPSSVFDVSSWLAAIGFRDVDIVWMSAGHALLVAKK